jgi:hypothetical protein
MLARPPKPVSSRTMQAIARAVESLPPFPLGAPLPDMDGNFHDKPCSSPKARYAVGAGPRLCHCGFAMGEHSK